MTEDKAPLGCYYISVFVENEDGQPKLVLEDTSPNNGWDGKYRQTCHVSEEFAAAWRKEFHIKTCRWVVKKTPWGEYGTYVTDEDS